MEKSFTEWGFSAHVIEALHAQQITCPTPVQVWSFTHILNGEDVVVQSQPGSGKTLAYLLPVLKKIDRESKKVQALILAPTQELAAQIYRQAKLFDVSVQLMIGGASKKRQLEKIKEHPQVVIGTPGRIHELLTLKKLKVFETHTLVLDEVDLMFELGGKKDVAAIQKALKRDTQFLFFSATLSKEVYEQIEAREKKPAFHVGQDLSDSIKHYAISCEEREKIEYLRKYLRAYKPEQAIIFVDKVETIGEVTQKLRFLGFEVEALYSQAPKKERQATFSQFQKKKFQLLVSTDLGSRGLDPVGLPIVFHYDPPYELSQYIHRAGRTGRMDRQGVSIMLVGPTQQSRLTRLKKQFSIELMDLQNGEAFIL